MKASKRSEKEQKIIEVAEAVYSKMGFTNARMEEIASEAGITKVTLYSYFQSKENLQYAVAYKALCLLIDEYKNVMKQNANETGLVGVMALIDLFIEFNKSNFLYSEALLRYFELIRTTSHGKNLDKLTDGLKESRYFNKMQEIHNLPFKYNVQEINRGKRDGSIRPEVDPMLATLSAWTLCIGYIKILSANGDNLYPLFNVDLDVLKKFQISNMRRYLRVK